jgi:hypothetical protein
MKVLMILASLAAAEPTTLPIENFDKHGAVQELQASLDDKLSVRGGTIASVNIGTATFRDGTTLTSTADLARLSASQTFTGSNSFTSTTTVGITTHTIVLNHSAVIYGAWSLVGSTHVTTASSISFSNIISSYTYRFNWFFKKATAGQLRMRHNGDSGASNYKWTSYGFAGGVARGTEDNSDASIDLNHANNTADGDYTKGWVMCSATPQGRNRVFCEFQYIFFQTAHSAGGAIWGISGTGHYDGSQAWNSAQLLASAGTFSDGYIYVEVLVPGANP